MPVPNTFANATATIPLSQLDANFATTITLGNTAIQLGNTVTTLNDMTLANVTVTSGNVTITNVSVTTANVTTANIATAQIANVTVSGTGTFAAGSNTAPSITTSGDTNTGIYFPAADTIAFTEGGVESMRINSSNNVGIGTSSPVSRLQTNSTGGAPNATGLTTAANASIAISSTGAGTLGTNTMLFGGVGSSSYVWLQGQNTGSNTSADIVLNSVGGNVGIGTTSPAYLMSLYGVTSQIQFTNVNTGTTASDGLTIGMGGGSSTDAYINQRENAPLIFNTNGTERARITSAGEVLVGTTSSQTLAGTTGNIQVETPNSASNITVVRNTANTSGPIFAFGKSRGGALGSRTAAASGDLLGTVVFNGADGTNMISGAAIYAQVEGTVSAGVMPTNIQFYTENAAGTFAQRMIIDPSGNVGIGITSPTSRLHLKGPAGSNPNTNGIVFQYSASTVNLGAIGLDNTSGDFVIAAGSGGSTRFYTNSDLATTNERMRITADGELLVGGTTSVNAKQGSVTVESTTAGTVNLVRNDTTVTTGEALGELAFFGNDTTSNTRTNLANIQALASSDHAAGDNPTDLVFGTTPDGSATRAEAMRITQAKNLKIGGTASRATTEGTNQLVLFNGTAPVGTLANGVSFYSAAGEARVMDAAGNSTLLSPHDQATNEWIFHSKHTPTGKVLRIDVEKMLRFINDHFGLDMVHEFTEE